MFIVGTCSFANTGAPMKLLLDGDAMPEFYLNVFELAYVISHDSASSATRALGKIWAIPASARRA
jgi:hypothetical protein